MPFSKSERKSGRGPFQRLNDSRRSVVLGGLAIGAVFSAAVLRRKRRGGEVELERPAPSSAQPDFGPPAAVDVPLPASEPESTDPLPEPVDTTEAETPINAATEVAAAEADPPATFEPATGELSAEEASVLSVLAQNGRADEDRTAIAVATSLERETTDVAGVLRKLGSEGVVSGELYTATGDKIWAVTERGVRRLGAQH
jgi:hypothetical protein